MISWLIDTFNMATCQVAGHDFKHGTVEHVRKEGSPWVGWSRTYCHRCDRWTLHEPNGGFPVDTDMRGKDK